MRPRARELIETVVASLDRDVRPQLSDPWAASALRSAVQLLEHVAVRVEAEPAILIEDNEDVREVLRSVRARIERMPGKQDLGARIDGALAVPRPPAHDAVCLDEANETFQWMIERLLRDRALLEAAPDVHEDLRAYLRRRLDRERPLYFPAFTGAPF